jgi:hydrogenase nickel incorporation protein HypA/HybF
MHELGIANEIIALVHREIVRRHLMRVTAIGLRIGALSAVNPDALSFGFGAAARDTPLASTQLNIEWIPVDGVCRLCLREFPIEEYVFICPFCGSTDLELVRGEELDLVYVEGE